MAPAIRVQIEGLREIEKALQALPAVVARRIVYRIMRRRMKPIVAAMKQNVPEDRGDLKRSIRAGTRLTTRQRARHRKTDRNDMELFAGPGSAPQATLQEFGTEHHGPQPFVRPAWDQHKNGLVKGLAADFWVEIRRELARAG